MAKARKTYASGPLVANNLQALNQVTGNVSHRALAHELYDQQLDRIAVTEKDPEKYGDKDESYFVELLSGKISKLFSYKNHKRFADIARRIEAYFGMDSHTLDRENYIEELRVETDRDGVEHLILYCAGNGLSEAPLQAVAQVQQLCNLMLAAKSLASDYRSFLRNQLDAASLQARENVLDASGQYVALSFSPLDYACFNCLDPASLMKTNNSANSADNDIYENSLLRLVADQCEQDFMDASTKIHQRIMNNEMSRRTTIYQYGYSCSLEDPEDLDVMNNDYPRLTLSAFHIAWLRQVLELGLKRLERADTFIHKVLERNLAWLNRQMGMDSAEEKDREGQDQHVQQAQPGWAWSGFLVSRITKLEAVYNSVAIG